MQPLKISRPLSRSSRPRRTILWLGIICAFFLLCTIFTPYIIRSNRGAIQTRIDAIHRLDEAKQEQAFRRLLSATGGDQVVARELATEYASRGLHAKAAETLEKAHGALFIEAASEYAYALDYDNVSRVSRTATNQKPSAESLAWQGIAFLNQKNADKGCEKAREATAKDTSSPLAIRVTQACEHLRNNESDPWKLIESGLTGIALEKLDEIQTPSSSELVLLAGLQQRQNKSDIALQTLQRAVKQTPYDSSVLRSILRLCSQAVTPGDCTQAKQAAQRSLELLPPL